MTSFPSHFSAVLSRHLPAIGPKSAAAAMGTDLRTVYRYADGESIPPVVERLGQLHRALAQKGRNGFLTELYGLTDATHFWISETGDIREAVPSLESAARCYMRISTGAAGDAADAYRRNFGGISLSVRGTFVECRYHERGLSRRAAASCCQWLTDRQALINRIVCLEDGRNVDVGPEFPKEAASAIQLAGAVAHLPPPGHWHVTRLPVAAIQNANAARLAALHGEGLSDPLDAIGRAGLFAHCSLIQRRNGVLWGLRIGSQNPLSNDNKSILTGKPLRSIPDIRYWELMEHCAAETLSENALTVRDCRGVVLAQRAEYQQVAVPVGSDLYVSMTIPRAA